MFDNISHCPFCGSKNLKKISDNKLYKNFYVEEIIFDLNISFSYLKKKLRKKQCQSCKTIFFSTWFNNFYKKKIFLSIYGQHNMGWQNFYDFKNKLVTPNHGNLFKDLKKKIKFKSYGEYGCPFNGLYFDILKDEIKKPKSLKKFIFSNMKHLSGKLRDFKTKNSLKKKRKYVKPNTIKKYTKYFIIDSSNLIWGKNDLSNNHSSLALADRLFNFEVYNSYDKLLFQKKIDLFGFFMTLDHCEDALNLLQNTLSISKYVLIHSHINPNITAQHHFVLTKEIKKFLEKKKIYNIDITNNIEKDPKRNKGINYKTNEIYLLCSKNKNNIKKYSL